MNNRAKSDSSFFRKTPGSKSSEPKKSPSLETIEDVICEDFIYLPPPMKAEDDPFKYTVIKLANGLTALIISSADSEKSRKSTSSSSEDEPAEEILGDGKRGGCSLTVEVGSFSDPDDIPGLAHFLEHMTFMGSKKYPIENEFSYYLTSHGGYFNAFTETELTTFHFDCFLAYFEKALDIFSQLFKNPLMRKEAMTREREAIDAEFQLHAPFDIFRKDMIVHSTAHKDNPIRKFVWGNRQTLMDNVTDDYLYQSVHSFRKKHYSAHRMKLVVRANVPGKILRSWIIKYFSGIKSNDEPKPKFILDAPFTNDFYKLYVVESLNNFPYMELTWTLPSEYEFYKSCPLNYIASVLNSAGKGSLVSYLYSKFWIVDIGCDVLRCTFFSMITMSLALTELGCDNVDLIFTAIFSYLKMMINKGPDAGYFRDIQSIEKIHFQHFDTSSLEFLSENMANFPSVHYLTGDFLYFEYRPDDIQAFMEYMTPSNVNISISDAIAKNVKLDKVEPMFKAKFTFMEIPDFVKNWQDIKVLPQFHLPLPNEFITTNFDIVEHPEYPSYPINCMSTDLIDIWHKPDDTDLSPFGYINIQILTNKLSKSPIDYVLGKLYLHLLMYFLMEDLWPATEAHLNINIDMDEKGYLISMNGFSQNLNLVLSKVADEISELIGKINENIFRGRQDSIQRSLLKDISDITFASADLQYSAYVENYITTVDEFKAIKVVDLNLLKKFVSKLFDEVHLQCLVQGNITKGDAIMMCVHFVSKLRCTGIKPEKLTKPKIFQLPEGQKCIRTTSLNKTAWNTLTTNYYQFGPGTLKEYVALEMFIYLMKEPLFDKLRTQEQLGYTVMCHTRVSQGILGFAISVFSQVDKYSLDHVQFRMVDFLNSYCDLIKNVSPRDFKNAVDTVVQSKSYTYSVVYDFNLNWNEIDHMTYIFDRPVKILKTFMSLKAKTLHKLIKKYLRVERKLTVQIIGHRPLSKKASKCNSPPVLTFEPKYRLISHDQRNSDQHYFITDITSFRKSLAPFPYSQIVL